MGKTTIQISYEFKEFLDTQAIKKGESYEQILRCLVEQLWKVKIPEAK